MHKQLEFEWSRPSAETQGTPFPRPLSQETPRPLQDSDSSTLPLEAQDLSDYLSHRAQASIQLRITNNVSTILSVRPGASPFDLKVSAHRMFLSAPEAVKQALAAWVKKPRARKAGSVIDGYIAANRDLIRATPPRKTQCITRGGHHDLRVLFDELNRSHFENTVGARITWGRMTVSRRRCSIRFGSYMPGEHLIRIHPLLDQSFVPTYFVRYIVYHEMLHAFLGVEETPGGRRRIHPPRFQRMEKAYPDYEAAIGWMDDPRNMARLLGRRSA